MKGCLGKKGFTLVELVISTAIMSIFFMGTSAILSSAAKAYIQETRSSGARGAIETAADDIKNYIMSGKNIKLMFYMDGTRTEIVTADGTGSIQVTPSGTVLPPGTILYTDGGYRRPDGTVVKASDAEALHLTDAQKQELEKVAEGIDLGYKMIYLREDGRFIQGLPYSLDYYRGMTMTMRISSEGDLAPVDAFFVYGNKADVKRIKKQKLYTVTLTGVGKNDIYTISLNTAVVSMNDSDFK